MRIRVRNNQRLKNYEIYGKEGIVSSLPYFNLNLKTNEIEFKNGFLGNSLFFDYDKQFCFIHPDYIYPFEVIIYSKETELRLIESSTISMNNLKINHFQIQSSDYFVNGVFHGKNYLQHLDRLDFEDFIVIRFFDFLLVSENIGPEYSCKHIVFDDDCLNYTKYPVLTKQKLKIHLKKLPPPIQKQRKSLILSVGPSVTMAMISTVAYLIQFTLQQNTNLNLVFILMPLMMAFSIVFWQTLQYFYFINQYKAQLNNRIQSYQGELIRLKKQINHYVEDIKKQGQDLVKLYQQKDVIFSFSKDFRLFIGRYTHPIESYQINLELSDNEDPLCVQIKEIILQNAVIKHDFYYIDIFNYKEICILNDKNHQLFHLIFRQLSKIKYNEISFVIFDDYPLHDEILKHPSFIKNYKRMCNQVIENDQYEVVFNLNRSLIQKKENRLIINFHETNEADLCIRKLKNGVFQIKDSYITSNFIFPKITQHTISRSKQGLIYFYDLHQKIETNRKSLLAFLGKTDDGEILSIDLHERGDGPHGLIAGTTGSGKSELLLSLCLSLAYHYPPDYLNFAIIDYKGGGLQECLTNKGKKIPHLVSYVSNLDSQNLDKIMISIQNECKKRQLAFKQESAKLNRNIMDLDDYISLGKKDIAHLVLIVDEFAELKKTNPIFIQEIVSLARTGRSMGVHLLLCTQKPTGVIDDQIRSNTNFIISLKMNTQSDSKELLQSDAAYLLKNPGEFYLMTDKRFQKAKAIYSNSNVYNRNNFVVELLDQQLNIKDKIALDIDKQLIESKLIVSRLNNYYPDFNCEDYKVWLEKPKSITLSELIEKNKNIGLAFAMTDDYFQKRQYPTSLDDESHTFVIYENVTILKQFIFNVLNRLNQLKIEHIYVSMLGFDLSCYQNSYTEIIDGQEHLVDELFKKLLHQTNLFKNRVVIIDEAMLLFECSEQFKQKLKIILENARKSHVKIILSSSTCSSIPYQSFLRFKEKLSLGRIQKVELFQLHSESLAIVSENDEGYYQKEVCLPIKLCLYEKEYFNHQMHKIIKGNEEPVVYFEDAKRFLIGINLMNYHNVYHNMNEELYIVSFQQSLLNQLQRIFIHQNVFFILLSTCDRDTLDKIKMKRILFIGKGFSNQFLFPTSNRKELKDREGYLLENGEMIKIRYVESKI